MIIFMYVISFGLVYNLSYEIYIIFFVIAIALWILWPIVIGAGWVPTPKDVINKMLCIAEVGPGDTVYDLGSGDGRIILTAAIEFGANAVGIEADLLRVILTRIWIKWSGLENQVRVIWSNFFNENLSAASVVTIYQSTEINKRLKEKLLNELCSGARVISYSFEFEEWEPVAVDERKKLYLYELKK